MLRSLLIAAVLVSTLGVSACNSGNKEQQPTADEQKRIQDEQQKAAEQQRQLTYGKGDSMSDVAAPTDPSQRQNRSQQVRQSKERQEQRNNSKTARTAASNPRNNPE